MTNTKPTGGEQLKKELYDILYEHSRVEGIRYMNEDEWPIDELIDWHNEKLTEAKREVIIEIKKYLLTMRQSITNQSSYSSIDGRCLYCGDISGEQYNEAIDGMEEKLDELSGEEVEG